MTEWAETPQDSFDPRLDAPVFGAVNLGGDTDPVFFAAKQPVRKPPWLTAHFSNLADLMERRAPSPSPRSASRIVLPSSNIRA